MIYPRGLRPARDFFIFGRKIFIKKVDLGIDFVQTMCYNEFNKSKEGNTMKGTEKQIAWAEDIKAAMIPAMDWAIENAPAQVKGIFETIKTAIVNVEYAGDLIEVYGDTAKAKTTQEIVKRVSAQFADRFGIAKNYNDQQRALLGK